jgi:hypothetical protein
MSPVVDRFVIVYSNESFTTRVISPMTLDPFTQEIEAFSNQVTFLYVAFDQLPLSKSRSRHRSLAWRREATARNYLIEGVKRSVPFFDDLILLCNVDEIATRAAIHLIRHESPLHY